MSHDAQTRAILAAAIHKAEVRLTANLDPDELADLVLHLQREVLHAAIRTCAQRLAAHFDADAGLDAVSEAVAALQREWVGLCHSEDDGWDEGVECTWENTSVEVVFSCRARDGSECRESAWFLSGEPRTQHLLVYLEERGEHYGPLFVDAAGERIKPGLVRVLMQGTARYGRGCGE